MSENNKQETHPNEAIETSSAVTEKAEMQRDQPTTPSSKKTQTTSPSNRLVPISLGLSAIAIALSGWLYFQSTQSTTNKDIEQLTIQQMGLDKKLNSSALSQSQLNQLIEQVKRSEHGAQTQQNQFNTYQAQQDEKLLSLESKLNRLNNTTKEDWKLAEAEYLIRLANQRLLLESDNNGAVTLLSNADDILNELADPIVFSTRKALAKDIQALKSISAFDLEGAYLQLNALYDNVQTLPQREPSKEWQKSSTEQSATTTENSTTSQLTAALENFWQSIRSLVVINYNHKPIKALLPPAEYQELVTSLQLQLEIAQVALIKGEPVIYQQALSRIANATTEHFETQSNSVISFLGSLTALQQLNPSPDLPQPRDSLMAMKSLMKEWTNRDDTPTTPSETIPNEITPNEATPSAPHINTSAENQAETPEENLVTPNTNTGDNL
ncbi:uroporphyrinogen-III C-methyltransferase [Marinomonas profundimaris]|uniref:HemX domain-containing protein n=1 Tax=Marinomonas profundimaris TaxID=1208321 RepID=W1RSV7_9GAMM|nr:uroporphyrinogen-III C-methyltransferase [Marinomonas profundimaris]ETI60316.1 hemX domain-containing protein [Marinomonas profundimaris]